MRLLLAHARLLLLGLARRRVAVAVLLLMPVGLYLTRRGATGQSIRALLFGMSWAVSTCALFAALDAAGLEARLRALAGRGHLLPVARLAALLAGGGVLAGLAGLLVALDQVVASDPLVALDLLVTAVVAVAVGTAVAALTAAEMEGMLILFMLAGLQAVMDPFGTPARLLPFWSSRELGTAAVDGTAQASVASGLLHAGLVLLACTALSAGAARLRAAGARR